MKILVICQYYFPEPFRITDICEELVRRGHEVTVVTGEPNYPEGFIYKGYENHRHADEIINGVNVHRCPIVPRKTGSIYRLLNYFSYPIEAKKYIKNLKASNGKPFDVVFANQLSPVMMAEPAIYYKKRYGTPVVMYCLDLWPVSLIVGGIKRKSIIYKFFNRISKKIYRQMDLVLMASRMYRKYLKGEFGIAESKMKYLPQYAEELFSELPEREQDGNTNLVLAGNIGDLQKIETVIYAADLLRDESVYFHIVGSGKELKNLQNLTRKLNLHKVKFYGRHPVEEMPKFYAMADAMLVTLQKDEVLALILPGKVQSYMAAGRPIIGAIDGETATVIAGAGCGFCSEAENAEQLAENIKGFCQLKDRGKLGQNARNYYEKYFTKDRFMNHLIHCMEREIMKVRDFK